MDPAEHTRVTVGLIEQGSGRRTLIRGMAPLVRLRPDEVSADAVTAGRILRLANAVAALKCRMLGGRAGIPSLGEVRAFLRSTGPDLPPVPGASC